MDVQQVSEAIKAFLNSHPEALPFGTRVEEIQILAGHDRKTARKRRPTADRASDKGDSIFIVLRPATVGESAPAPRPHAAAAAREIVVDEAALAELARALRDAAQTPGHSFVALKWFRDVYLPRRAFPWASDPDERDHLLREGVRRGWLRIDRIPNPRNPGFPTAALHLNSGVPELRQALGEAPALGWDFKPLAVRGEPMSETLRRMREQD